MDGTTCKGAVKRCAATLPVVLLALLVTGCGSEKQSDVPLGAKVNGASITLEQIDGATERSGSGDGSAVKENSKKALEQIINQQLLVQQAEENKMASDPKIARAIDYARRQVLAKAWLDKLFAGLPKPDDTQIGKFYDDNPALFANRRVYRVLQLAIPGDASLQPRLEQQMKAIDANPDKAMHMQRLAGWLQSQGIAFRPQTATQGAEQLPTELVTKFAQMKPGDWILISGSGGHQVAQVAAAQDQPLTRDKARPLIENYLVARARMEASQNELKRLRTAARIEYFGEYLTEGKPGDAGAHAGLPEAGAESPKMAPVPASPPSPAPGSGGPAKP